MRSKKVTAEQILETVRNSLEPIMHNEGDWEYASYVLFQFTGSHLKEILDDVKFQGLIKEIKNRK